MSAYTVVLVTTGDQAAARRIAREAAQSGLEAGVLRSDDYGLGEGFWIVFAGRFDSQPAPSARPATSAWRYPRRVRRAGQAEEPDERPALADRCRRRASTSSPRGCDAGSPPVGQRLHRRGDRPGQRARS